MRTLIAIMALALAACGAPEFQQPTDPPPTDTVTQPTQPGDDMADDDQQQHSPVIQAAIADLARRLGVAEAEIQLVSHRSVTWSDGSIGCPEPGMMYTQALVDGSLTILAVDGVEYSYHAGGNQDPFLCENPESPREGAPDS